MTDYSQSDVLTMVSATVRSVRAQLSACSRLSHSILSLAGSKCDVGSSSFHSRSVKTKCENRAPSFASTRIDVALCMHKFSLTRRGCGRRQLKGGYLIAIEPTPHISVSTVQVITAEQALHRLFGTNSTCKRHFRHNKEYLSLSMLTYLSYVYNIYLNGRV